MSQKTICLQTNYNNKLSCEAFLHIDVAPQTTIQESKLQETVFIIQTKDGSHEPVQCQLQDICRLPLYKVNTAHSWASHSMHADDFINKMLEQKGITLVTPMAVYFYKQLNPPLVGT